MFLPKYLMFIYVIGPETGPQKIGISKDVETRLGNLQTGNPLKLMIHHVEEVDPDRVLLLEQKIHKELNHKRKNGEWFDLTWQEARDYVIYFVITYEDDPLLGI